MGGNRPAGVHPEEYSRDTKGSRAMMRFVLLLLSLVALPAWAGPSMRTLPEEVVVVRAEPPPIPSGWATIPSPLADVHAAQRDRATALRLSRHIAATLPNLATELELPVGARIHVVVASTQAEFHSLQPGQLPDWADGTAWPHRGWIFLRAPRLRGHTTESLEQVLEHELVHILLGRAFGSKPVPRWLQEGLAQLKSGEFTAETTRTLAMGTLGDNLLSLHELSRSFPKNALRAHLAYAQSADFVAYIQNTYGKKALNVLIHEMAGGETFSSAIRIATGDVVDDIDLAWRSRLQDSPFQFAPLMDEGVWWGLGALLVPLAWFAVRRRNRKKIDRWKREEILEDALYRTIERVFGEGDQQPTSSSDHDDEAGPPIWPVQ